MIKKAARNIVRSVAIKEGDMVVIGAGVHAIDLVDEMVIETYKRGGVPVTFLSRDRSELKILSSVSEDALKKTPKHLLAMIKASDAIISVEPYEDPHITTQFPRDKVAAKHMSRTPISQVIFEEKRWVYAGWPTKKAAEYYNIDYSDLEEFIIGGMCVDPETLMQAGNALKGKINGAEKIHVEDDNGTDFTLVIKGRRINIDDGIITEEDIKLNDLGNNLPAGEVFIAPVENAGSGRIYCPVTVDPFSGRIFRDLMLEFKDGILDLERSKVPEELKETFKMSEEVDRKIYGAPSARKVAEIGIGTNPRIKRAIGYILTDEKVIGSVHVAFGENIGYGGTSRSSLHWDFVTSPGVTVTVIFPDGRENVIMEKGKHVF